MTRRSEAARMARPRQPRRREDIMDWETPLVIEIAVGLEVTSYLSDDDTQP
jgi:coenzyme PQQ precursor peptide PqqA